MRQKYKFLQWISLRRVVNVTCAVAGSCRFTRRSLNGRIHQNHRTAVSPTHPQGASADGSFHVTSSSSPLHTGTAHCTIVFPNAPQSFGDGTAQDTRCHPVSCGDCNAPQNPFRRPGLPPDAEDGSRGRLQRAGSGITGHS